MGGRGREEGEGRDGEERDEEGRDRPAHFSVASAAYANRHTDHNTWLHCYTPEVIAVAQ